MKITSLFLVSIFSWHILYASSVTKKVTFKKVTFKETVQVNEYNDLPMISEDISDQPRQAQFLSPGLMAKREEFRKAYQDMILAPHHDKIVEPVQLQQSHSSLENIPDTNCLWDLFSCCSYAKVYASETN